MPTLPDHLFLAVFDGHGGDGSAIFAENFLINVIERNAKWMQYVKSGTRTTEKLCEILIEAFEAFDSVLRKQQDNGTGKDFSGCTAVTCMITPTHIICANAGDSRAVLGRNGQTIPLSYDHKPNNKIERERIIKAGGTVMQ